MGIAPSGESLTYQELNAWVQVTDAQLTPWESESLIHLSAHYVSRSRKYAEENAAPPLESEENRLKRLVKAEQNARDSWG